MGNSESSNPVRNMDKRTARREYRTDFMRAISNYRSQLVGLKQKIHSVDDNWGDGNIKVFVRKRPIFKHELNAYEFDVATCTTHDKIVVHDARMHNDMKRQLMNHHEFQFDRVFNENVKNDEVYSSTAKSLVSIACDGGYSTCLVYGQTGSGKTFTMSSIYELAAYDIFNQLENVVDRFKSPPTVSMSFFEIAGDFCHDLLNRFTPTQLLTGSDGSVHAFPVVEPTVSCAEELIAMIQLGMGVRTTAATGVHDQSSRSHAVLRIYVQRQDLRAGDGGVVEGTLTLVDLAGSEHRIDSMYHGKERRKETGNINASLMALKECIRARAAGQVLSFQYRRSKLTQALKSSFSLPSARTIVIATVSPASKDTEHSLNTLRHACIMHGQQDHGNAKETRFVTGGTVTAELIGEINLTEIGRKNANIKRSGGVMDGPKSHNGNIVDSKAARAANNEVELTEKDRLRIRKAAEARSIAKLLPQYRDLLKHFRGQLGCNRLQASRLQRIPTDPNAVIEEEIEEAYVSPPHTPQSGRHSRGDEYVEGSGEDDGSGEAEVDEEDFDFHSSLTKKHRLDLHELATAGRNSMVAEGSDESVEDEVESFVERNRHDRHSTSSDVGGRPSSGNISSRSRPGSASARDALKKINSEKTFNSEERRRKEEQQPREEESSPMDIPQLRSKAGQSAVLHVRRTPSTHTNSQEESPNTHTGGSTARFAFQSLYDVIYGEGEGAPEHILHRQLTALLRLQGHSDREIEMMFQMNALKRENEAMKRQQAVQTSRVNRNSTEGVDSREGTSQSSATARTRQLVSSKSPPIEIRTKPASMKHSPVRSLAVDLQESSINSEVSATQVSERKRAASNSRGAIPVVAERQRAQASAQAEKERRDREAMTEAAAQLEQQAATRRARQEAARQLREQQDEDRKQKAARNAAASRATKQSLSSMVGGPPSARQTGNNLEDPIATQSTAAACRASIRKHEEEISSLMDQLQQDGLTEASQYALRKNIAVRKAALLRERRTAAEKSFLEEDHEEVAPPPALKGATRYGSGSRVVSHQQQQQQSSLSPPPVGSVKQFSAHRPDPQNFDDVPVGGAGRTDYSPYAAGTLQGRTSNSRDRQRKRGEVDPEEAFGGPRWETPRVTDEDEQRYFSPRSAAQEYQQQQQQHQVPVRASPSSAEKFGAGGRKYVGAAAAPFGNDYSWENSPR